MELISHADTMAQFGAAGGRIGKALDEFQAEDLLGSGGSGGFLTDYSGMLGGISGQLKTIGGDTAAIKRSVSLSEEDMQMLVDMAAQRYVNHINLTAQTPVITIHGQNTGNFQEDARWLEDTLMRLLVMLVIGILMQVLWHILDLASRLPVLEGLNKMLGAAAGALKGLVIVWGLFCIIQLCSMTEIGQTLLSRIEESPVLKGIYDYNFLFRIIMKIIGI